MKNDPTSGKQEGVNKRRQQRRSSHVYRKGALQCRSRGFMFCQCTGQPVSPGQKACLVYCYTLLLKWSIGIIG